MKLLKEWLADIKYFFLDIKNAMGYWLRSDDVAVKMFAFFSAACLIMAFIIAKLVIKYG